MAGEWQRSPSPTRIFDRALNKKKEVLVELQSCTMCRLRDCGLNPWPEPAFVGQMQPEHMLSRKVCASSLRRRRNLTVVEAKKKSFKPRNRQAAAGASHAEVRREQHEHVCTWISDTVYACMCVHMCVRASIYACLYMSLCRSQCI